MREIKIGEKLYKIHYGQNAICSLEDELNEGIAEIYTRFTEQKIHMKDIRALIWAGMLKDNRDITPEALGDLCDAAGVRFSDLLGDCIEELNQSFSRMIPDVDNNDEKSKKK